MKKKIFISLIIIGILSTVIGVFNTSYSAARRNMAIDTVNGGEAEFISYEQLKDKESTMKFAVNLTCILVGASAIGWVFKDSKSKK